MCSNAQLSSWCNPTSKFAPKFTWRSFTAVPPTWHLNFKVGTQVGLPWTTLMVKMPPRCCPDEGRLEEVSMCALQTCEPLACSAGYLWSLAIRHLTSDRKYLAHLYMPRRTQRFLCFHFDQILEAFSAFGATLCVETATMPQFPMLARRSEKNSTNCANTATQLGGAHMLAHLVGLRPKNEVT